MTQSGRHGRLGGEELDSAKLNDWMQVVGVFAVVASLIFVGLQMKQAQDIAVAAQYQERTASSIEAVSARSQIAAVKSEMAKIISDRYASYDSTDMSPEDLGGLYFGTRISFMSIDNVHFQQGSNNKTLQGGS